VVKAVPGAKVVIDMKKVKNKGWRWVPIDENDTSLPEVDRIRGFQIVRDETREVVYDKPGTYTLKK
jgi:UDP-sugar pyrophosphorylase